MKLCIAAAVVIFATRARYLRSLFWMQPHLCKGPGDSRATVFKSKSCSQMLRQKKNYAIRGKASKAMSYSRAIGRSQRWYEIVTPFLPGGGSEFTISRLTQAGIISVTNARHCEKIHSSASLIRIMFCAVNAWSGRRIFSNNIIILREIP